MYSFDCQPIHRDWALKAYPEVSFVQDTTNTRHWRTLTYGPTQQILSAGGFPGYDLRLPRQQLVDMTSSILGCSPQLERSAPGVGVQTSYHVGNTGFLVYKRPLGQSTWWYLKPIFPHRDRRVDDCQRLVEHRVWNDIGQPWKAHAAGFATRAAAIEWLQHAFADASEATYGGWNPMAVRRKYWKRWQLSQLRRNLFGSSRT